MAQFCHLHVHTQFSLLDGAARIEDLVDRAAEFEMPAIGISDHGNLFGVPKFVLAARKKGIQPVIGSEFYLTHDHRSRSKERGEREAFHQILWCKNAEGYHNLIKLSSISYTEGYYYKPRIDRELLQRHAHGLVATTCCLASEINQAILGKGPEAAEALFRWYLELFGQDYYVEIQDHGLRDQQKCNHVLLDWASKYQVKVMATNDVHYVRREDAEAHDLLLALQTASDYTDPNRFRFTDDHNQLNPRFYFKSPAEMLALFPGQAAALETTLEIADKCRFELPLTGDLILPTYRVPEGFGDMDDYLRHLAFAGAQRKYPEMTQDLGERIERELAIIRQMGFAGYFLIVQEFTNEARRRGVLVGPGRGSAAGSVVAYCIGIIDIDPLRYNLLFERFLNPERVSPPDIDIDFDDEGREAVINFVVEKYGRESVSQIITYGTMGAKTAIRDVGRVLGVPLAEVNRIAKYIPERPGMTFEKALDGGENPDHYRDLRAELEQGEPLNRRMLQYAQTLEGTARQIGIHAAGVIIAPGPVADYVPVAINNTRDNILITQYDGPNAELAGMLKMDFLGLRTLSILKTACRLIEESLGQVVDLDTVSLDDPATFELYQRGETVGTFQFESDGMRKYLRQLKPTSLEDLIAMNALYRPGPMDNIPLFIARKQGQSPIVYDHPLLEPILANTYGIMVYQEQIMEVARVMAGYSLGQADLLRRAMGKKKKDVMEKERARFVAGATANGIEAATAEQVFDTMEKFASYGFNKSHSAAYSLVAFRTAYLKANYPAQYMCAVLAHNQGDIDKISFFIEECRRMGLVVMPPDVNESQYQFSVSYPEGPGVGRPIIRFGLAAIKGVGEGVAQAILEERRVGGPFTSLFDLTTRVPYQQLGKRVLEWLAYAGALDNLAGGELKRWHYFPPDDQPDAPGALDLAITFGRQVQEQKNSAQASLFGEATGTAQLQPPPIPPREPWPLIKALNHEKDVIGFYLSAHPLDIYRFELERARTCTLAELDQHRNKRVRVGGIVTAVRERLSKKGTKFGIFTLEDYSGATEFVLYADDYAKHKGYLETNSSVFLTAEYLPKFNDPDAYELKIRDVRLLDKLLDDSKGTLTLRLALEELTEARILMLEQTLANHRGNYDVYFTVESTQLSESLRVYSRNARVKPDPALRTALAQLGVAYDITFSPPRN